LPEDVLSPVVGDQVYVVPPGPLAVSVIEEAEHKLLVVGLTEMDGADPETLIVTVDVAEQLPLVAVTV